MKKRHFSGMETLRYVKVFLIERENNMRGCNTNKEKK